MKTALRSLSVAAGLSVAAAIFVFSVPVQGQPALADKPATSESEAKPSAAPRGREPRRGQEADALSEARMNLEAARNKYGEQHPVVVDLRNRVELLESLEPKKISLDFKGGRFSDLLDAISKHPEVSFSIIAPEEAGDLNATDVPPFSLRNTTITTIMEVVRNLLQPRGFQLNPVSVEKNSVICVAVHVRNPVRRDPARRSQFESYQLAPFLADQSVDDIVSAIRTAWELDPNHDRDSFQLKYHPATTMLLVSGPEDGIFLVRNILGQLKHTSQGMQKVLPPGPPDVSKP